VTQAAGAGDTLTERLTERVPRRSERAKRDAREADEWSPPVGASSCRRWPARVADGRAGAESRNGPSAGFPPRWAEFVAQGPGKVYFFFFLCFSAFFLLNLNLNLVFNPCAHLLSNHILEYEIQIFGIYLHYFLYFHNISLLLLNPSFQCGLIKLPIIITLSFFYHYGFI
jgi:hypothetical protein